MPSRGDYDARHRVDETSWNPRSAVLWLEGQPDESMLKEAQDIFGRLLGSAGKPKQSSGNACVKMCGFVDICAKSKAESLRQFAFTEQVASQLFDFYIEWNEKDSHRSMRLVLDFLALSVSNNPDPRNSEAIRARVLIDTVSMITLQSSKPSAKSAMTALDHFLQKKIAHPENILNTYRQVHGIAPDETTTLDNFVTQVFELMGLSYVAPVAGRLLMTVFTSPFNGVDSSSPTYTPTDWHRFLCAALRVNVELLEPIKLYLFVPLFKKAKAESYKYLDDLFSLQGLTGKNNQGWDVDSMLWLGLLEAGKKAGAIDEPGTSMGQSHNPASQLRADVLGHVLCHESHEARSSAVSILIASPFTTKPYTKEVLELLENFLPSFHADSDPKFRNDVLGHTRNMIKRIQGTVAALHRDHERALKKAKGAAPNKPLDQAMSQEGQKINSHQVVVEEIEEALSNHQRFVYFYTDFLKAELAPTASYQRHITALKALSFVFRAKLLQTDGLKECRFLNENASAEIGFDERLVNDASFRSILDLVMDPFDDVRDAAASLIMLIAPETSEVKKSPNVPVTTAYQPSMAQLEEFCTRADLLATQTARADHSDGAARSYELLCRWAVNTSDKIKVPERLVTDLEKKLSAAETDLAAAVLDAPVHGNFAALRFIWASLSQEKFAGADLEIMQKIQDRIVVCCERVWKAVRHVLCSDSPEGHLPEELEEVDGLDTKDLLSYSFRAIHESSTLMRSVANNARQLQAAGALSPSWTNFHTVGSLTFTQLSTLRHRGAFTTVTQTFSSCCQLVKFFPRGPDEEGTLLDEWYAGALDCIHNQMSTTRRSAGIPSLIVGILSANSDRPSFGKVMTELQSIARRPALISETDGSKLPQVHALNSLKEVFKTSMLSKTAEAYLTECLDLAASSLRSEVWAVRNCGLIFLRSLIDCLLGTNENKDSVEAGWDGRSVRISYHKFPGLPSVLVNLLELGQKPGGVLLGSQTAESVFPALDIIRRAGPPEEFRDQLYDIITWYLGSRIWHVREIAARTLCSFLLKPDWMDKIRLLIKSAGSSANKLHGALFTLKFVLVRLRGAMPEQLFRNYPQPLGSLLKEIPQETSCLHTCPEAQSTYVEILNFVNNLQRGDATPSTPGTLEPLYLSVDAPEKTPLGSEEELLPTALFERARNQAVLFYCTQASEDNKGGLLTSMLKEALQDDVDVACDMLDTITQIFEATDQLSPALIHSLTQACIEVCFATCDPEPRWRALSALGPLLDRITLGTDDGLGAADVSRDTLFRLWEDLRKKPMNPALSNAVVEFSGSILAAAVKMGDQGEEENSRLDKWMLSWGSMMSAAGTADKTFDSRQCAVNGIARFTHLAFPSSPEWAINPSFTRDISSSSSRSSSPPPNIDGRKTLLETHHLPWILALYDLLNDDDEEIRTDAARSASPIVGHSGLIEPFEAADRLLLSYLPRMYAPSPALLRAHAVCRLAGHGLPGITEDENLLTVSSPPSDLFKSWTPVSSQLRQALRFDDALFVVEEQNLFIDETREAYRWRDVLIALQEEEMNLKLSSSSSSSSPPFSSSDEESESESEAAIETLRTWVLEGVKSITDLLTVGGEGVVGEGDDGPLGWTSKPAVFAICTRVMVAAAYLYQMGRKDKKKGSGAAGRIEEDTELETAMRSFKAAGEKGRVHGLLMTRCAM